jgi:hypothetical protein
MSTHTNNRIARISADQAMIDGFTKHKPNLPASMPIGSHTMTCDDVIAVFQGLVASGKAVQAADAARAAAVKADRDKRAQMRATVTAAKRLVVAMFMQSPDTLAEFGLTAPKPQLRTTEEKAQAAAKARATRKTLGTKGSRQKKAALVAADVHPNAPAAPAAPSAQATPAPAPKPAS